MTDSIGGTWERFAGDDWAWSWTTTDDVALWSNLKVTIRAGKSPTSKVIATTEGSSPTITTTGTNFAAGQMKWKVASSVTANCPAGVCWIEVDVTINGNVTTVISRPLVVKSQFVGAA